MTTPCKTVSKVFRFRGLPDMLPESRIARWLSKQRGMPAWHQALLHPGFCAMTFFTQAQFCRDIKIHDAKKEVGFLAWSVQVDIEVQDS